MNRRSTSVAANPVLIGAATVLVVIVAVFLAYNANNGLPFVPTYSSGCELPNASNLVTGNEVRIGGDRVGIIDKIEPRTHRDGSVTARLHVKLETTVKPLPVDSTIIVRPRSPLGLKYVEVTRGSSSRGLPEDGTLPLRNATPRPVEFDDFFNMFDEPTRAANQVNLREFGDALAGRGTSINEAIVALDPLTKNAIPVLKNLADPQTRLRPPVPRARADRRRRRAGRRAAGAAVPQPRDDVRRVRRDRDPVPAGHDQRRPAGARHGDPLVPDRAAAARQRGRLLPRPAAGRAGAARRRRRALATAFDVGTTQVRRAASLNDELALTLRSLQDFAQDPQVPLGIHGLRGTVEELTPTVDHLAGAQINCNYLALLLYNAASIESDGTGDQGTLGARRSRSAPPTARTARSVPASRLPTGRRPTAATAANHLHANPYPLVGAQGPERHLHGRQRGLRAGPDR